MGEKLATARAYDSLHDPVKFWQGNGNNRYNLMPQKSCTTAGFTKHSYHKKELVWTFDADHVIQDNRRKLALHC